MYIHNSMSSNRIDIELFFNTTVLKSWVIPEIYCGINSQDVRRRLLYFNNYILKNGNKTIKINDTDTTYAHLSNYISTFDNLFKSNHSLFGKSSFTLLSKPEQEEIIKSGQYEYTDVIEPTSHFYDALLIVVNEELPVIIKYFTENQEEYKIFYEEINKIV